MSVPILETRRLTVSIGDKTFCRELDLELHAGERLASTWGAAGRETFRVRARALKSDLNDPKSYVYQLKDDRYLKLARSFNFDSKGNLTTPLVANAGQNLRATIAYTVANATAGKVRLRVMYTTDGKGNEIQAS